MAPNIAPPHPWQQGEEFDPSIFDPENLMRAQSMPEWHAVFTIQLGELVESGVFDWESPLLDWSAAAADEEQYARVCAYFVERFRYREISITPFLEWAQALKRKLVYELMPKYKPLYAEVAESIVPLASENEYMKRRKIASDYPETLLSENADYISDGEDEEWQRIKVGKVSEAMEGYAAYHAVDEALLDELEVLFVSMYTSYNNGW